MGRIISPYSLVTAVVIYNLVLILIYFLSEKNSFMEICGTKITLFITLLAVIRLLSPIDFPSACILRSEKLIPAVNSAFELTPFAVLPAVSLGNLVAGIWLAGMCFFTGKYALELRRALRSRKAYSPVVNEAAEQTARNLGIKYPILTSMQVSTPHTVGFFHPVIYLPDLNLCPVSWEYILRHEVQHIKEHDMWIKLFYAVLEVVMWWNPVSHLFMRKLDAVLELRCDTALVAGLSDGERLDYLVTMLSVVKCSVTDSPEVVSSYFTRYEKYLMERFKMALSIGKRKNRIIEYAAYAIALAVFCSSYFVVVQPRYRPTAEPGMYIDEEGDEQFILFDGENYSFWSDGRLVNTLSQTDVIKAPYNTFPIYGGD